jgi:hypothetical protein
MAQLLHILRKDFRHCRLPILLSWAALAVTILGQAAFLDHSSRMVAMMVALTLVGWLVASIIHGEALPGDRQMWLTRPYSRLALFGAKLAGILLAVPLPVLVLQSLALALRGYEPWHYAELLAAKQLVLLSVWVAGAVMVACWTRGTGQFLAAAVALLIAWILASGVMEASFYAPNWEDWQPLRSQFEVAVLLAASFAVTAFQFRTRRSRWSAAFTVLVISVLPNLAGGRMAGPRSWTWWSHLRGLDAEENAVQVRVRPESRLPGKLVILGQAIVPLEIGGLGSTGRFRCAGIEVAARGPHSPSWRPVQAAASLAGGQASPQLDISLDPASEEMARVRAGQLRARLHLTILRPAGSVIAPAEGQQVRSAEGAVCEREPASRAAVCTWPLIPPAAVETENMNDDSDHNIGAEPLLSSSIAAFESVTQFFHQPAADGPARTGPARLHFYRVSARIVRDVELDHVFDHANAEMRTSQPVQPSRFRIFTRFLRRLAAGW